MTRQPARYAMDATSPRWQAITDSEFPWERDALAFVRDRLPDHDPYRAWANFEFIADDGSINEVDLLVLSPKGFYLVEIKRAAPESWRATRARGRGGTMGACRRSTTRCCSQIARRRS